MTYRQLIDQNIGAIYQTGIAARILQHMDRIRNVSDLSQARRWVMELFQNSRDAAYGDQPVRIKITLDDQTLQFSHNGRPFRVKDILAIVNQVSSKNPGELTVGQFGTGFMTTYQLSEMVEIQSVLRDSVMENGVETALPYKTFSIQIDRRGTTKEEILSGIFKTMEALKAADSCGSPEPFDRNAYNTSFIYHLDNEESRTIAGVGLDDLQDTILYVLLFSERISRVELVRRTGKECGSVVYEREMDEALTGGLRRLRLWETRRGGEEECIPGEMPSDGADRRLHTLIYLQESGITLAACGNEAQGFLPIPERTPRIFVDFPLMGAEAFPFPVVINSRKFRTNEPRSGITLVDNLASRDALVNKEIMERAVELYREFLHAVVEADFSGMRNVIAIPRWIEDREMSESWVKQYIYRPIYQAVAAEPFIITMEGRRPLECRELCLVYGENDEETNGLKTLLAALKNCLVPSGDEDWCSALSGYELPDGKIVRLEQVLNQAQLLLQSHLDEEKMQPLLWCRSLYERSMKNSMLAMKIRAGEIQIFPNQNPEHWRQRRLFSVRSLRRDPEIPEILKDVSDALDRLQARNDEPGLHIRDTLLHGEFGADEIGELEDYEWVKLSSHIINRSSRKFPVTSFKLFGRIYEEAWKRAWCLMISCGSDETLYRLCRQAWGEQLPEYRPLLGDYDQGLWRNACAFALRDIFGKVGTFGKLEELQRLGNLEQTGGNPNMENMAEVYCWLNGILEKGVAYLGEAELKCEFVFPNQKGELGSALFLKRDGTEGEELKEISREFSGVDPGCDVYAAVLDRNIRADQINLPCLRDEDVAMKINNVVQQVLAQWNLSDADPRIQEACTRLLGWIQEHPGKAVRYFPGFCREEEQMRLLTPRAAVRIQKKANDFQKMLERLGAEDIEQAFEKLEYLKGLPGAVEAYDGPGAEAGALRMDEAEPDGSLYDPEADVFLGGGLEELDEERRAGICREIGVAGELYAMEQVKAYFVGNGYHVVSERGGALYLEQADGNSGPVRIDRPDNEFYHQAGWDIRVTVDAGAEAVGEEVVAEGTAPETTAMPEQMRPAWPQAVYYLEVKTHTCGSVLRRRLYLSNEQMKAALRSRERYLVLNVVYNYREKAGEQIVVFENPAEQIVHGTLRNTQKQYRFYIS